MLVPVTPEVKLLCEALLASGLFDGETNSLAPQTGELLVQRGAELGLRLTLLADNAGAQIVGNLDRDDEYWGEFTPYEITRMATGLQPKMAVSTRGGGC